MAKKKAKKSVKKSSKKKSVRRVRPAPPVEATSTPVGKPVDEMTEQEMEEATRPGS